MAEKIEERVVVTETEKDNNTLFPVFIKLEKLSTLLVGGGYVASEKLNAIFQNSPKANLRIVASEISPDVRTYITDNNISFEQRPFEPSDLDGIDLVIIAINDKNVSREIHLVCQERKVLTNVADTPELCDFYLSSVVQKGNLKIAISTNGKSPTIAKRVKEMLNETFPTEIDEVLDNMEIIRQQLRGDFSDKVRQLNNITSVIAANKPEAKQPEKRSQKLLYAVTAICLMVLGHLLFTFVAIKTIAIAFGIAIVLVCLRTILLRFWPYIR